jgi:hypothetical protein
LAPNRTHHGGIVVGDKDVKIDTAKMTDLRPGTYTVTYTTVGTKRKGTIRFTITGSFGVLFVGKPPVDKLPNTLIPVTVKAMLNGKDDKHAESFKLAPSAGLTLYADSSLNNPVGAGTVFATDSATGLKKLWVTSALPGTYSINLTLSASPAILDSYGQIVFTLPPKPPRNVRSAHFKDANGDGHVETVEIFFDSVLSQTPKSLGFQLTGADGAPVDRMAQAAEISVNPASALHVIVRLANPFPYGLTSVANTATAGKLVANADIPLIEGPFAVADSVGPVLVHGIVYAADSAEPVTRVVVTLSEAVTGDLKAPGALVFKRGNTEMSSTQLLVSAVRSLGGARYEVLVDSLSQLFPIPGDSVALGAASLISDAAGNKTAKAIFKKLDGNPPKPQSTKLYVTFANGKADPAGGAATGGTATLPQGAVFIPIDRNGKPLNGKVADGRCEGCPVGEEGRYIGPIIHLEIPGPVDYEFKIFSNLGEFVAVARGKIEDGDLKSLLPLRSGSRYLARLVWSGQTATGGQAGTGVYVLSSKVTTALDLKTGAPPATQAKQLRFGILRLPH